MMNLLIIEIKVLIVAMKTLMVLFGSTKNKITEDANLPRLEITEEVLEH